MGSTSGSRPTCPGTSATSESSTAWPRCWCVSGAWHAAPWWCSRVSSPVGRPAQGKVGTRLSPEPPWAGLPPTARGTGLGPEAGAGAPQCPPSAAVPGQAQGGTRARVSRCLRDLLFPTAEVSVPEKVCSLQDCGPHALHRAAGEGERGCPGFPAPPPRGAEASRRSCARAFTSHKRHRPRCLSACGCEKAEDPGAAAPAFAPRLPLLLLLCPRCPEQAWRRARFIRLLLDKMKSQMLAEMPFFISSQTNSQKGLCLAAASYLGSAWASPVWALSLAPFPPRRGCKDLSQGPLSVEWLQLGAHLCPRAPREGERRTAG